MTTKERIEEWKEELRQEVMTGFNDDTLQPIFNKIETLDDLISTEREEERNKTLKKVHNLISRVSVESDRKIVVEVKELNIEKEIDISRELKNAVVETKTLLLQSIKDLIIN